MTDPDWAHHCAEPVVERISEALERDAWDELGGCPRSWKEAADLYRRCGVRTLPGLVNKVLGPPIDPKRARRGDIVMVDGALGICRGEWVECLDRMQPLSRATRAWSIEAAAHLGGDIAPDAGVHSLDADSALAG